jgi:hypothetical protein
LEVKMAKRVYLVLCIALISAHSGRASQYVFDYTFQLPRVFLGTESVAVSLRVDNAEVATRANGDGSQQIWTKADATVTFSKVEEAGDYAHGITFWVNGGDRHDILYSFLENGSFSYKLSAGSRLDFLLYRYTVIVYTVMSPTYSYVSSVDAEGPAVSLSPASGTYGNTIVAAASTDGGCGLPDPPVISYTVFASGTANALATGGGSSVSLETEGTFDVQFTVSDRLGNSTTLTQTYTVDHGQPALVEVHPAVYPRADGALDFQLSVTIQPGAGIEQSTVRMELQQQAGPAFMFTAAQLSMTLEPSGLLRVALPGLVLPRSALLLLNVAAVDKLGRVLTHKDTEPSLALPPPQVAGAVLAAGIAADAFEPAPGDLRVPRYRVPVLLDRRRDAFNSPGVTRYRIWRKSLPAGALEEVASVAPGVLVGLLTEHGGQAVFTDTLLGRAYAHQSMTYLIDTEFSANGHERSSVAGSAPLPNIQDWLVRVRQGSGVLQTYQSGKAPYSSLRLKAIAGVRLEIDPDCEGDPLAMRLEYKAAEGTAVTVPQDWTTSAELGDLLAGQPDGVYTGRFIIQEAGNSAPTYSDAFTVMVDVNAGQISHDEVWASNTTLTTSLEILRGAALTIAPNVQITVARVEEFTEAGDPPPGGSPRIIVEPGARLFVQDGSSIAALGWREGSHPGLDWMYWGGIYARDHAQVEIGAATLAGARRGLITLPGSAVKATGSRILGCGIGVHALGSSPRLSGVIFTGNQRYGIKEDAEAAPVVTDCEFSANTYDYYDEEMTVVGAAGIDALDPHNHGNTPAAQP